MTPHVAAYCFNEDDADVFVPISTRISPTNRFNTKSTGRAATSLSRRCSGSMPTVAFSTKIEVDLKRRKCWSLLSDSALLGYGNQVAMGKGQQQHSIPPTGSKDESGGDELAGSTLEDYFASHKVTGHVSQHLLNDAKENDVMATEDSGNGPDRILTERKSEQDDYEDDYESETSTQAEPPSDVAGMTLSDYLHVREVDITAQEKLSKAGSLRSLPPQLAPTGKKVAPTADVSGMSLDLYLGAAPDVRADKKPSPKSKRKNKLKQTGQALPQNKPLQPPFSVKGSSLIQGQHSTSSQSVSSDEECVSTSTPGSNLTPFQLRQKRKDRAKAKQQRHVGSGSSISKAILMAEAASSPSTILSVRDRDKRKTSSLTVVNSSSHSHHPVHHSSHSSASNVQPPLPKLGASPSVRSMNHKDHDTSSDDTGVDTADKLPPLYNDKHK